jgi:hypothetical protein
MKQTIPKFFNKAQRDAMAISAHDSFFVCSRGTGKSEGIDARFILQMVWAMPRSCGAFISPTYTKALQNTLPAICHALSRWGYIKDVHYFVGRKAPLNRNFRLPFITPMSWDHVIHFFNGTIMHILSFDGSMSANSMSLDWIIGPEAKYLDYNKIKSEVNPANRGNRQYFDECPWHHAVLYSTDMPTSKMGYWILDKDKEMQSDHIVMIRDTYRELMMYKDMPEKTEYVERKIKELSQELAWYRKWQPRKNAKEGDTPFEYTVHYAEYDIFDNYEIVGEEFISQMKRDLPPLIFRTAILNERLRKIANGFYSALDDNAHFYIARDNGAFSEIGYDFKKAAKVGCAKDGDFDFNKPLHIAFDANSAINSLVVGQVDKSLNTLKVINSFFVKTPDKLPELVEKFCDYYGAWMKREVVFYYDHTFVWTNAISDESYADIIIKELEKHKFNVTTVYIGQAYKHDLKHMYIDKALKGNPEYLFPQFNLMNNEYLKIAMEQTGVRQGRNGFEKDKSPERTEDSPDNPDELKTHITDAFDTLFIGTNFYYTEPMTCSGGVGFAA